MKSRDGGYISQTCKKYIFVREPNFGFKNVRTVHLEIFSKFKVDFVMNIAKLVFISTGFSQYQSKILTNFLESFDF